MAVEETGVDVGALREEAAAIRRNLEEMAADRALGLITRPQLLAATERAGVRLADIGDELDHAARENVLAPLVAAENAAGVWETLDISRKRAVIKTLMAVTLESPGRGSRRPFDPATVKVTWKEAGRRLIPARPSLLAAHLRRGRRSRSASVSRCSLVSGGAASTSRAT